MPKDKGLGTLGVVQLLRGSSGLSGPGAVRFSAKIAADITRFSRTLSFIRGGVLLAIFSLFHL